MSETSGKLTVEVGPMARALKAVRAAVPSRSTIPILLNVMIEHVAGDQVRLTATDLDREVSLSIPNARCTGSFATTVTAAMLTEIFGGLDAGAQAELSIDAGRMTVRSGRARFKLPVLPVTDFPKIEHGDWKATFALDTEMLRGLLGRAAFAMSTEETRYYLCGILLHLVADQLHFVALDGYRLARHVRQAPAELTEMPDVIIPRDTITLLVGMMADHKGEVSISLSATKLRFAIGDAVLVSKTIDATYPDYVRVIPLDNPGVLTVNRDAFERGMARMMMVTGGKERIVKIDLSAEQMVINARGQEAGEASEEVPCIYSGGPLTIGFNGRLLRDVINAVTAETVEIHMDAPMSSVLIRDVADDAATFVCMPFRV